MRKLRQRLFGYLESLRFPWLLLLTSVLFVLDVFVPDALPFVDEILLGLIGLMLGRIKRKPPASEED